MGRTESTHPIVVDDLWFYYDDEICALRGVTLSIEQGAFVAVIGQNGAGKTTLVKHFNGLLKPTRGRVWIHGRDTTRQSIGQLSRSVGYVFQNPDHQIFQPTTREEIEFGPRNLGLALHTVQERSDEALELFGLTRHADRPPALLGFGLRRKVSIAAVYAMRPQILILDEPTAGLDWSSTLEVIHLLQDLCQAGHTILLVTHDMRVAAEFAPRILVLHNGHILFDGETRTAFLQREMLRQTQIEAPQITQLATRLRGWGMPGDTLTVGEFFQAYQQLRSNIP
jgi:energy-coupling factor transport system ATP-binding protein